MCEHKDCMHSLGPGSHCDTCDRLQAPILFTVVAAPPTKTYKRVREKQYTEEDIKRWLKACEKHFGW